jgi:hypothetical protein
LTEFSSSKTILQLIHLLEVAAAAPGRGLVNPPGPTAFFSGEVRRAGNWCNPQLKRFAA